MWWAAIAQAAVSDGGMLDQPDLPPMDARSGGENFFDNSRWTVATSGSKATATAPSMLWLAVVGLGALGLLIWAKKG